ncbi:MAG: NADH-quinone oxidoreductase subunit H, partial [Patescibacteria group bacterium]
MSSTLILFVQFLLVLGIAPGVVGAVRLVKARLQNRRGASLTQPYFALAALMRKEMTIPSSSTWVFHTVPFVVLASALFLAAVLPTVGYALVPAGFDNIFLIAATLAVGAVFLVMGGMDTGSTFGNMGASREMTLAALVEPALYLALGTLALVAGSWSVGAIVGWFAVSHWFLSVP